MMTTSSSYLEEYRKRYGNLCSTQEVKKAATPTANGVDELLARYLNITPTGPLRTSIPGEHSGTSEECGENNDMKSTANHYNNHLLERAKQLKQIESLQKEQDDDDSASDDAFQTEMDATLPLPATLTRKSSLTVDTVITKLSTKKARRTKSNPLEERRLQTRRAGRRLHSSFSGSNLVSQASVEDVEELSPSSVTRRSSATSLRSLHRQDSTLSNKSIESTHSRGSISRESDIMELSDEELDMEFGEAFSVCSSNSSENNRMFSQYLKDINNEIDTVEEVEVGTPSCPQCESGSQSTVSGKGSAVCDKCVARQTERKQTVQEIIDSEEGYNYNMKLIRDDLYRPLLEAGLLSQEELTLIFGNLTELISVSDRFLKELRLHFEEITGLHDDHYEGALVGKLMCESSAMFLAYETYCLKYNNAITLLEQLCKDRELLNLFLEVSQNDNPNLRRMDIKSFLMVPVQRVMKYPLLLQRLLKATHNSHVDHEDIGSAIRKLTNILDHINSQSKSLFNMASVSASNKSCTSFEIALTKLCLDTTRWKHDELHMILSGKIGYLLPTDGQIIDKLKNQRFNTGYAVIVSKGRDRVTFNPAPKLMFHKRSSVTEAMLIVIRKGSTRLQLLREPLNMRNCIISRNCEFYDIYEIQENIKDLFIVRPVHNTDSWFNYMKYFSMVLGGRNQCRRNASANILLHA